MKIKFLESIIYEMTECSVKFVKDFPIQYNIFEHVEPEMLAFNSFCSLNACTRFLNSKYEVFKTAFNTNTVEIKNIDNLIFIIKEKLSHFYTEQMEMVKIFSHEFLHLHDERCKDERFKRLIKEIKIKVSGFLKVQKNMLISLERFLKMKREQDSIIILPKFAWMAGITALTELITVLWRFGAIKMYNSEPVTKKYVIEVFELLFSMKIWKASSK